LDIADGELVVFVGPSGCGKSTTLRMLAGLDDVTFGKILIDGRDVTALPPKDRNIAMVFQNYALSTEDGLRKHGLRPSGP
jgi:multiple sugar transport system ATP-binding protein